MITSKLGKPLFKKTRKTIQFRLHFFFGKMLNSSSFSQDILIILIFNTSILHINLIEKKKHM